ncbi:MAG: glycosyltransferase [Myxococcales bacterium]|nr:MAG: glycosyltransferase [Myxococcales bacterium]
MWILLFLTLPVCAFLLITGIFGHHLNKNLKKVTQAKALLDDANLPELSLVIPVRNEAQTLPQAVDSVLAIDYPKLQIIYVDDRSDDESPTILDNYAKNDPRMTVLHLDTLKEGWLGKVRALHTGFEQATGEWVLASDADLCFSPQLTRYALSLAVEQKLDHLAIMPKMLAKGFWYRLSLCAFGAAFMLLVRPKALMDPQSKAYTGIGAFNLIRRSRFDRSKGFEWLRLEVADDMGLGMLIKQAHGRSMLVRSCGLLTVSWYPNLKAMMHGLEKNLFAVTCGYSYLRLLATVILVLMLFFTPWLALFQPWFDWLSVVALLAIASNAYYNLSVSRISGMPTPIALFAPLGLWTLLYALMISAYKTWKQDGIYWRESFYSLDTLRKGRRVKL